MGSWSYPIQTFVDVCQPGAVDKADHVVVATSFTGLAGLIQKTTLETWFLLKVGYCTAYSTGLLLDHHHFQPFNWQFWIDFGVYYVAIRYLNLLAPKVPRRGSLAVDATGQICQTGTASTSAGGGLIFDRAGQKSARDCGNLHILQIGTKSSECTVSIRHGRNIGPTWGQLWPARPQPRPNLHPLDSNFAPAWLQDGATSTWTRSNFGPSWGPYGQGRPGLTPVGFGWQARPLLSLYPILWVRAVLVVKRLE